MISDSIPQVSVLFVREDSIYKSLNSDCWDIKRDAANWKGGNPCIVHPPCRSWGRLRHMSNPRPGEKELALLAIHFVRSNGGVLEHPNSSTLWPQYLPNPGQTDSFGGYSISIDQFWFGHKAKKSTMLYIVGCSKKDLPPIPIRFDAVEYIVGHNSRTPAHRRNKIEISKAEREITPIAFAKWLLLVAARSFSPFNPSGQ